MEEIKFKKGDTFNKWEDLEPYFDTLLKTDIKSVEDMKQLIINAGNLSAFIDEVFAWAYINMTCHTDNEEYVKRYQMLMRDISPKIEEAYFNLENKINDSKYFAELPDKYNEYRKSLKNSLELYRENNLALKAEEGAITSQYAQLIGSIMVKYEGEEYTLREIRKMMETDDRKKREKIWFTMYDEMIKHKNDLTAIFDRLLSLRIVIAKNADFNNYRDYMFKAKERFDYTPEDCLEFHKSVEEEVVPIVAEIHKYQMKKLGLKEFKPWDLPGIPNKQKPLKPFGKGDELLEKTIKVYKKIRPELGKNLELMQENNLFDLDSRKGKASGGYNYPLRLTNMPFIFMNSVGTQGDLSTMMHEGGHAMHSFATADMDIDEYKNTPSESAELASMSMELITMEHWNEFYENEEDLIRAKREQLEGTITLLPWIMIVDAFQHWIYTNPEHTLTQRDEKFIELLERYNAGVVNWDGIEKYKVIRWIYQGHITEVPFYYIEYAIAQLGALQIWRNYNENPDKAITDYLNALKLGSSVPLPVVYEAAGIKFDFSRELLSDLMQFVKNKLNELEK